MGDAVTPGVLIMLLPWAIPLVVLLVIVAVAFEDRER
jgi:hypothetical protein